MKNFSNYCTPLRFAKAALGLFLVAVAILLFSSPPSKICYAVFCTPPLLCLLYRYWPHEANLHIECSFLICCSAVLLFLLSVFWALALPIFYTLIAFFMLAVVKIIVSCVYLKFKHLALTVIVYGCLSYFLVL